MELAHPRAAAGPPTDRPEPDARSNVQVVWEKFCRYWDVEPRYMPMAHGRYASRPSEVVERARREHDRRRRDPRHHVHRRVRADRGRSTTRSSRYNEANRPEVPLHVDAASGGFVAPFLHPHLEWDFRLPWVKSINVSGHKYGLTYPGVGFVVWRDAEDLPEDLVFHVNYLGGDMPTFTLNFSRPGNQIVGQYYNFIRLGHDGYRTVMESLRDVADAPVRRDRRLGPFELISDGTRSRSSPFSARTVAVHRLRRLRPAADATAGRCPRTRCPRRPPTSR